MRNIHGLCPLLLLVACSSGGVNAGPVSGRFMSTDEAGGYRLTDGDGVRANEYSDAPADLGQRKLVKTVWLAFEIDDDGEDRAVMNRQVAKLAESMGGYIGSETSERLTVRVPAARLDEALAALNKLGTVVDRGHSVADVTRAHRDLSIRIENNKKLKTRLLALLDQATEVEQILAVEKELSRVTMELETLEAEMRNLSRQIELATITIEYRNAVSPGPVGWVFYGLFRGVKWLFVWD